MQLYKQIKNFPIFADLKKSELKNIIANSFTKTLKKNEQLFTIGERRDVFYVVVEGEIEIVRELGKSGEVVEIVTQGEYIAEHALFNPKKLHSHTAVIHSKKAVVMGIPGKLFLKLPLKTGHKLLLNLLPIISDNFSHASNRIMTILKISEILSQKTQDAEELGNAILKIMLQAIQASKAIIVLNTEKPSETQIKAIQGFKSTKQLLHNIIKIKQDGILEPILIQGKKINISRSNYLKSKSKVNYVSNSALGMPLKILDKTIGAILLIDKVNKQNFNTNNEVLLQIISKMLPLGFYYARKRELQEAQRELTQEYISI